MLSKGGAAHARGAAAGGARQRSRREVGWSGVSPPRAVSRSVIHDTRTVETKGVCARAERGMPVGAAPNPNASPASPPSTQLN